ncbi:hypothetical protein GCM10010988_33410 [Cnuibacter physcomitrellae]|uniref:Uncharacterized protein n=1 Tax=Cnuibacter physcomitrellae TaxID=1619308 RepID=A0A1X9LH50_9MICO|nr:hypothetical protein B5808_04380 [Cnuibacter physcomitrellae]GGI41302.1 hypothetical protein GCM10010988_33410 [Cnuibacter physcomitrellae]
MIGVLAALIAAPTQASPVGAAQVAAVASAPSRSTVSAASAPSTGGAASASSTASAASAPSTATTATPASAEAPALASAPSVAAAPTDAAGCGTACTGISASPRELAQWLLTARDQGRFQVDPTIDEIWANEIAPIANGTVDPRCDIDGRVLQLLVVSIKQFGTVKINDLNRWCANDGEYNCTGEFHPPSPWHCRIPAVAVDFGRVGSQRTNGWGDGSNSLIALMNQFMPANTHLGQKGCFGRPSMASLGYSYLTNEFNDTCNHLHVDIGQSNTGLRVTANTGLPIGSFDQAYAQPGGVVVRGWAADLDTTQPIQVDITLNGVVTSTVRADGPRPDVEAAYPGIGQSHGFGVTVPASPGVYQVCAVAVDPTDGTRAQLGCATTTVMAGAPVGSLDTAIRAGTNIDVKGWAFDPDTTDPIDVVLTLNGTVKATVPAKSARADVAAVYPGYGANHGYTASFAVSPGSNQVCAYGVDSSTKLRGPSIGCITVDVSGDPIGGFDSASANLTTATLVGWAADLDQPTSPVTVHVYVGGPFGVGTMAGAFVANIDRPDVASAYPPLGSRHGYSVSVPVPTGTTQICIYGINVGQGANSLIGCREASTPSGPPVGNVEDVSISGSIVSLKGWAVDPDTSSSIAVHLYYGGPFGTGTFGGSFTASASRSDIASAFPGYGAAHGFQIRTPIVPGSRSVCVYAINVGGGDSVLLGCPSITPPTGPPVGNIESATLSKGQLTIKGWALDPDTAASVDLNVYLGGPYGSAWWGSAYVADVQRPDVASAFPGYGANHGMQLTAPVPAGIGRTQACVYVQNVGGGSTTLLGCPTVTATSGSPFGTFEEASATNGSARVKGWAIDPDTTGSISIRATVNGKTVGTYPASSSRPDVGAAYPASGSSHGFAVSGIPIPVGTSDICLYGVDKTGGDGEGPLGCQTVSTQSGPPRGNIDAVATGPGSLTVSGWALDPDTPDPIDVHVYVNGVMAGKATATASRPDVAAAFPGYGAAHGYSIQVPATGGPAQVCVYGINVRDFGNPQLACRTVDIPGGNPFGNLETATVKDGKATVGGWVIDPDTAQSVTVHVYVNGAFSGSFVADGARTDVGAAFPQYGSGHGYSIAVPVPAGTSQVCVYGINQGTGSFNPQIGCKAVTR